MSGSSTKKNILYQEVHSVKDNVTGEVLNTHNRKIIKVERTPDFIMLFTEHVAFIEKLQSNEKAVLAQILQHYVGVENVVFLSANTKKDMASELNVGISFVHKALKALMDRKVLIKGIIKENQTYLNPHLFGKGNWENIYKMRQVVAYDFDFQTLEMQETRQLTSQYEGEIGVDEHEIVGAEEYTDRRGTVHQDITISKLPEQKQSTAAKNGESTAIPRETESIQLEVLKEQNRAKELCIQEMQLKIELKREGIEF